MGLPIIVRSKPGGTTWFGKSEDGSGHVIFIDDEQVSGEFTITRGEGREYYTLVGAGDIAFLVEHKEYPFCGMGAMQ
jgi:hypothetical protein